jgi:hypothetical protein
MMLRAHQEAHPNSMVTVGDKLGGGEGGGGVGGGEGDGDFWTGTGSFFGVGGKLWDWLQKSQPPHCACWLLQRLGLTE